MLRIFTTSLRMLTLLVTAAVVLAFAPNAFAASLTITRAPAPPSAVLNDGSHSLGYSYSVTYTTTPELVCTQITDPSGNPVAGSTVSTTLAPTTPSPHRAVGSLGPSLPLRFV